ncbi:FAD-linked oxidoreductase [Sarocladium strictum]
MPTNTLVRSLILTSLMGQNWILNPALSFLRIMCNSKFAVLNPDRNPVLNKIMRWSLYGQFASGTNASEVSKTISELKTMGYHGVILGYAKEILLRDPMIHGETAKQTDSAAAQKVIEEWKKGTIGTLNMIEPGDFLAVKITGAGPIAVDAMKNGDAIPAPIAQAMDEICHLTRERGCRLWIDAEQQALQTTLDRWAIDIMRKHNTNGQALVYNTIQAYLKGARANASQHLILAAREGWTLGIKLVRGAYLDNEFRSLIHDTKEDTASSYDDIADMLISQRLPEEVQDLAFPSVRLFLATHNATSIRKAIVTWQARCTSRLPTVEGLESGQIQGMADELSCSLLQLYEEADSDPALAKAAPGVYKCLNWGSVSECLGYLYRRAVENRGAVERTEHMRQALWKELCRRMFH